MRTGSVNNRALRLQDLETCSGPSRAEQVTQDGNLRTHQPAAFDSAAGGPSQCSLHRRIERAEKPGPAPLGQRGWTMVFVPSSPRCLAISRPASALRIFACVQCLPVGKTARALFLRQRAASGISEATHTSAAERCSAIQLSAASALLTHQNHTHLRGAGRPDRSRAVGDDQNIEAQTHRHAVDLLPGMHHHRRRFQSTSGSLPQHISHSRSFDHRGLARPPLTAITSASRCPTKTTRRLPRVTPV